MPPKTRRQGRNAQQGSLPGLAPGGGDTTNKTTRFEIERSGRKKQVYEIVPPSSAHSFLSLRVPSDKYRSLLLNNVKRQDATKGGDDLECLNININSGEAPQHQDQTLSTITSGFREGSPVKEGVKQIFGTGDLDTVVLPNEYSPDQYATPISVSDTNVGVLGSPTNSGIREPTATTSERRILVKQNYLSPSILANLTPSTSGDDSTTEIVYQVSSVSSQLGREVIPSISDQSLQPRLPVITSPSRCCTSINIPSAISDSVLSPSQALDSHHRVQTPTGAEEAHLEDRASVAVFAQKHPSKSSLIVKLPIPKDWAVRGNMAPVKDPNDVSDTIKDVIQNLYDIQSQTHGFIPETQELLVDKMTNLTQSLAQLQKLASQQDSPSNPVHQIRIAPEIVDYVDDGRNPDIFTRDFVENVQRGNAVINGKQQAFKDFSQIFAKALKEGITGVDKQVDRVMNNAGIEQLPATKKSS